MSDKQVLDTEIAKLPEGQQYLVRECAHELQRVLDRYKNPMVVGLANELAVAHLQDSIKY
ncbi:hypothetical protein [Hymenobacter sp. PAMC 26628]|uniref:hypothetical protein n=1 Tax=Hymenobacter sp. PAMC 26628 TaxID=1484118 RepID=UPI0007703526|nr:hypothetical protein [Hymenobacter sp. PAMC 26628]AMJ65052.1 hypothetical protein AXW84_06125 [Hymenobacter sp. PAMC 26628]